MTAVDPDVSFLVDALEPKGPSTQEVLGYLEDACTTDSTDAVQGGD
jgi:hypothetical protein